MTSRAGYYLNLPTTRYLLILLLSLCGITFDASCLGTLPENKRSPGKYFFEQLCIRTDRDVYIAGEKVWLKIYKVNGLTHTPEKLSKIIYVETLDSENNPVTQFKISSEGTSGTGVFILPDTLRTGNYVIRSYTNWMQNFPEDLYAVKQISVINPFKINDINIRSAIQQTGSSQHSNEVLIENQPLPGQADGLKFKISLHRSSYSSREKIRIGITATDNNNRPVESNFSVTVAKSVTIYNDRFGEEKGALFPGMMPDTSHIFLPELEGQLISGIIRNRKTGEPIVNENISLSFVGKVALCQFAKSNEKGEFHFKTDERGVKEIVIQPLSDKIRDYYVELENPFRPSVMKYDRGTFLPDTGRLDEINKAIISMQIGKIYEPYINRVTGKGDPPEKRNFYGKPDNTILLAKYIELTSVKEVVKEIIPGVSTTRKNDNTNFRLFHQYQSKPFENSPFVLVDGVPVYDIEKVLSVNSKDLEKIDVFTTRYYISDIVFDGILHFITKDGNLSVIEPDRSVFRVEYYLPEEQHSFYSPDYSSEQLLNSRIPDFRNTLFWNPDMRTDASGETPVEFYASDESGDFIIAVEGISDDGRRGSAMLHLKISGLPSSSR